MNGVFKKCVMLPLLAAMSMVHNGSAFLLDTNNINIRNYSCCNTSRRTTSFSFHLNDKKPDRQDVRDNDSTGGEGESNQFSSSDGMKNKYKNRPIPQRRFRSIASANASKNRIEKNDYNKNQSKSGRNSNRLDQSRSTSHPLFTTTSIGPPLQQLPPQSKSSNIISPSVIRNNAQGELPITYTNDSKTLEKWLSDNCILQAGTKHTFLGFDVEAAPNVPWCRAVNREFIDRPATVQISTPYESIIVHLTGDNGSGSAPASALKPLQAMLSDPTILKVGAGIDEDMLELYRWDNSLNANSRFDIGGIGSDSKTKRRIGLQKLVGAIVGVDLAKSKKIAMSDWSMIPLTDQQVIYASRDAWAGAAVMENIGDYDGMNVDCIAQMLRGKEREMQEIDSRARLRKQAKLEMKEIITEVKEMASGGSDVKENRNQKEKRSSGRDSHKRLLDIMSKETRAEVDRLQIILDETSPDGLMFFDADKLGLDFSFV
mmetsp:Transcript_14574/g.21876  ORF Transcript_14574/g.21876 Transcript_14574/m.21876 type:complete len:486 (-) Transcript_14574:172-1629(-)